MHLLPSLDLINLPEQKQLRIGDVANLFSVQPHVLRYWEKEFESLRPRKTTSNQRCYSKRDLEIIWILKYLLYEQNFTVSGAGLKLAEICEQNLTPKQVISSFDTLFNPSNSPEQHQRIQELEEQLQQSEAQNLRLQRMLTEQHRDSQVKEVSLSHLTKANSKLNAEINHLRETIADLQTELDHKNHPTLDFDLTLASLKSVRKHLNNALQWAEK